ncbi:MAG TPA: hypothetical protein VFA59_01195 [Vicinamibacterales bacterium]|nr:hypothetical protein [Vicinamibacterales bacterium]
MTIVVAGVLLGVIYTLSPLAVVFAIWAALLMRWATRDATLTERRWIIAVMTAAVAIRVAAIALLPFTIARGQATFTSYYGDAMYAIQRSIWIRNVFVGVPIAPADFFEAFEPVFGYSSYNFALAYFHVLFGPSPYGVALVSVGLFLTAATLLYRRCRVAFGHFAAFVSFTALLLLPTWIAWSVAPLKESMQVLLLVAAVEATILIVRGRVWVRVLALGVGAIAISLSLTLRNGAGEILVGGVVAGAILYVATRRWWLTLAMAVLLPLVTWRAVERPSIRGRIDAAVIQAARRHIGHTFSPGAHYRLLDDRFYMIHDVPEPLTMHTDEAVRFLVRAPIALLIEPRPWAIVSPRWALVAPQQIAWYALLILAVVGVGSGGRRDPLLTSLCIGIVGVALAIIGPNSGNIGTAMRHRDMMAPFVIALAGIGGQAVASRVAQLAGSFAMLRPAKVVS